VPSPEPESIVELPTIKMLLADGAIVICAGGGGIPVRRTADGWLSGVEAVIDKDLTAALMARSVDADALLLLTDVSALEMDFGTPKARLLDHVTTNELEHLTFPSASMGPKVAAACRFVHGTRHVAAIGRLEDAAELLAGTAGTSITDSDMQVKKPEGETP
jgi:carbamate kinase